jgi:hypothetical protein
MKNNLTIIESKYSLMTGKDEIRKRVTFGNPERSFAVSVMSGRFAENKHFRVGSSADSARNSECG